MMLHNNSMRSTNLVTQATQVTQSLLDLHTTALMTCSRATNMPSLERIAPKEIFTARSRLFNFFKERSQESNNNGDQGMTPIFIREEEETVHSSLDSFIVEQFKVKAHVHESPGKTHLLMEERPKSRRKPDKSYPIYV